MPLAAEGLADVDDHVDLRGPRRECLGGLGNLERGGRGAVREADDGADSDGRAGEEGGVGEGWMEERVVDGGGEMGEGGFDCGHTGDGVGDLQGGMNNIRYSI